MGEHWNSKQNSWGTFTFFGAQFLGGTVKKDPVYVVVFFTAQWKNPAAQSGEGVRRSTSRRPVSSGQPTWNIM